MSIGDSFPKYDIPIDYIMDDALTGRILEFYKMFPAKIKAGVFAICLKGEVRATLNLSEYIVKKDDFVTILPGSFLQIHDVTEDTVIAFIGFSSSFPSFFLSIQYTYFFTGSQYPSKKDS